MTYDHYFHTHDLCDSAAIDRRQFDWDEDYLALAEFWANRKSKDPSTKVGSVIVRPDRTQVNLAYNGFARGLPDDESLYADRAFKMACVVHAEENAIVTAREPLHGYTIYTAGLPPCAKCGSLIIQSGIKRVVAFDRVVPDRWVENMRWSLRNFLLIGVEVTLVDQVARTARRIRQVSDVYPGSDFHVPSKISLSPP